MYNFWENQEEDQKTAYIEMLQIIGSLSNLFSDSSTPYLYYRAHENLFCKVFNAKNLSRGDISFDAIKNDLGIGLKTFINGNGKTFSLSKNTLLKRFDTSKSNTIKDFKVEILEDPFDILLKTSSDILLKTSSRLASDKAQIMDYIILPLYSAKFKNVREKSGLNLWNAKGRPRHEDEVYIPIPSWIHEIFNDFYLYSKNRKSEDESGEDYPSFNVELPNGEILSCRVSQTGGKALMSNPNKALGQWILRDVLNLEEGELVTMENLREIGIDS